MTDIAWEKKFDMRIQRGKGREGITDLLIFFHRYSNYKFAHNMKSEFH